YRSARHRWRPPRPAAPHGRAAMERQQADPDAGLQMSGTLHLVGVGPGDTELLTLKAVRILGAAHVVAYPTTGEDSALALSIAAAPLHPAAERLPVAIARGFERDRAQAAYDAAPSAIRVHLDAGRGVACLCEGVPLFYGSAMYLTSRLAPHAPV